MLLLSSDATIVLVLLCPLLGLPAIAVSTRMRPQARLVYGVAAAVVGVLVLAAWDDGAQPVYVVGYVLLGVGAVVTVLGALAMRRPVQPPRRAGHRAGSSRVPGGDNAAGWTMQQRWRDRLRFPRRGGREG